MLHFLVSAILVAKLPEAHHRFGIAMTTSIGVAALAVGMLCWSVALVPWQLFAAAGVSGVGWAATSGAAIIAMVSPWFDQRPALALGHALNGASAGGVVFAPLWAALIASVGYAPAIALVCVLRSRHVRSGRRGRVSSHVLLRFWALPGRLRH
jgi:hypothetical protein